MANLIQIERHRYHQGQRLRSADFNALLGVEDQLRWWHNRALHDAYGVVVGLQVRGYPRDLGAGDITVIGLDRVEVRAGLAYDCTGRELIVTQSLFADAPDESAHEWSLLLRDGSSGPELVWIRSDSVVVRDGVVLARSVSDGAAGLTVDPDFRVVRGRAARRPLIGSGRTLPGKTAWRSWSEPVVACPSGVEVTIDTSAAGFERTPHYLVTLKGPSLVDATGWGRVLLLPHVRDATSRALTVRVWAMKTDVPEMKTESVPETDLREALAQRLQRESSVWWIGVESSGGSDGSV